MAVVVPLIAIAAGGVAVAGAVTAGVVTVAAIAGVASIVSGVAALAGNAKVAKIAGIVALGLGAFSMVSGAAGAAPIDNMNAAAPGEAAGAIDGTLAAERGNQAISGNAATIDPNTAPSITENMTAQSIPVADQPSALTQPVDAPKGSLFDSAAPQAAPAPVGQVPDAYGPNSMQDGSAGAITGPAPSPVQQSFMDSLKNVGQVLKDHKELVKIGGGMLEGAFSPERRKMSLYQQQIDMQKEEMDRKNRNANNIVGLRLPVTFNPNSPGRA